LRLPGISDRHPSVDEYAELAHGLQSLDTIPISRQNDIVRTNRYRARTVGFRSAFIPFGVLVSDKRTYPRSEIGPRRPLLAYSPIMDGLLAILGVFSVFSPPVLIGIAWVRFLDPEAKSQPIWRRMLGGANLLAVSVLLSVSVLKLLGNRCNADADDWSCVIAWRSFAGSIVRLAPFFLVLTILGARRTRILTFISVLAIVFDVILVDTMA
jgi:hypothetical protein